MWGRKRRAEPAIRVEDKPPERLRDALRRARVESAERTAVIVDLHDAEVARLELLNEALDPVFAELPEGVELFDRGISRGETPRLWIDAITHVVMGRDKRSYRFVQDARFGRKVLAETNGIPDMVEAVTKYLAQRLLERERALAGGGAQLAEPAPRHDHRTARRSERARLAGAFFFGLATGAAALVAAAMLLGMN